KRIDAAGGRLDDIAAERRKRHEARAALVDQRRDAGMDADEIGLEAEAAGHMPGHMRMRIDKPRQYECAAHIDCLAAAAEIGRDPRDLPIGDRDIVTTIYALRGIDDPPALQHQIQGLLSLHVAASSSPERAIAYRFPPRRCAPAAFPPFPRLPPP